MLHSVELFSMMLRVDSCLKEVVKTLRTFTFVKKTNLKLYKVKNVDYLISSLNCK